MDAERDVELSSRTHAWMDLLVVFSPLLVVVVILTLLPIENPLQMMGIVWFANAIAVLLVFGVCWYRRESIETVGITFTRPRKFSHLLKFLVTAVGIFLGSTIAFLLGAVAAKPFFGVQASADFGGYNFLQGNLQWLLISLLGVFVASSLGEELIYRGFLISRLDILFGKTRWGSSFPAVCVSAVLFGLAHFKWGPVGVIQTTFMGAALAGAFVCLGRRLWPLVAAHFLMDALLLVQLYLE